MALATEGVDGGAVKSPSTGASEAFVLLSSILLCMCAAHNKSSSKQAAAQDFLSTSSSCSAGNGGWRTPWRRASSRARIHRQTRTTKSTARSGAPHLGAAAAGSQRKKHTYPGFFEGWTLSSLCKKLAFVQSYNCNCNYKINHSSGAER